MTEYIIVFGVWVVLMMFFMHQTNYEVGHPGQEITRQKYVAGVVCVCLLLLLLITYKLFLA
jgi:hypothetical protein